MGEGEARLSDAGCRDDEVVVSLTLWWDADLREASGHRSSEAENSHNRAVSLAVSTIDSHTRRIVAASWCWVAAHVGGSTNGGH